MPPLRALTALLLLAGLAACARELKPQPPPRLDLVNTLALFREAPEASPDHAAAEAALEEMSKRDGWPQLLQAEVAAGRLAGASFAAGWDGAYTGVDGLPAGDLEAVEWYARAVVIGRPRPTRTYGDWREHAAALGLEVGELVGVLLRAPDVRDWGRYGASELPTFEPVHATTRWGTFVVLDGDRVRRVIRVLDRHLYWPNARFDEGEASDFAPHPTEPPLQLVSRVAVERALEHARAGGGGAWAQAEILGIVGSPAEAAWLAPELAAVAEERAALDGLIGTLEATPDDLQAIGAVAAALEEMRRLGRAPTDEQRARLRPVIHDVGRQLDVARQAASREGRFATAAALLRLTANIGARPESDVPYVDAERLLGASPPPDEADRTGLMRLARVYVPALDGPDWPHLRGQIVELFWHAQGNEMGLTEVGLSLGQAHVWTRFAETRLRVSADVAEFTYAPRVTLRREMATFQREGTSANPAWAAWQAQVRAARGRVDEKAHALGVWRSYGAPEATTSETTFQDIELRGEGADRRGVGVVRTVTTTNDTAAQAFGAHEAALRAEYDAAVEAHDALLRQAPAADLARSELATWSHDVEVQRWEGRLVHRVRLEGGVPREALTTYSSPIEGIRVAADPAHGVEGRDTFMNADGVRAEAERVLGFTLAHEVIRLWRQEIRDRIAADVRTRGAKWSAADRRLEQQMLEHVFVERAGVSPLGLRLNPGPYHALRAL